MGKKIIEVVSKNSIGNKFVDAENLQQGMDGDALRWEQLPMDITYRTLTDGEINTLLQNRNYSTDWSKIFVHPNFDPNLVRNSKFFGVVRIGYLEDVCLSYNDLVIPVGIYDSCIISSDLGNNVVVNNVHYLSNYIVGDQVILVNVDEIITTNYAKFGNGILKDGEDESVRIWLELCNENGGRKVLPFDGMLASDAWLWSKYRNDKVLMDKFQSFTQAKSSSKRGFLGKIGARTIIKNSKIIKDVNIGEDAYIKGANKLKNLTINSGEEGFTQIGEGCELVNGIIGYGCRVFYGVKAVRFILADHSQLKYGARLINSYLGYNATISCCEVLNSLIFPAHEQHHNNSFLIAATIMGQSNIPAGATIGSNHNSRAADGEVIARRGFWPGLCVNLKHNSLFPCFTILAKGNYDYELNVKIPFSLVSHNVQSDQVEIMVGYWLLYNMYAIERNAWKYKQRDARIKRSQYLEYDYLAPDSVNDILTAMDVIEAAVGKASALTSSDGKDNSLKEIGRSLLKKSPQLVDSWNIVLDDVENSRRGVLLTKVAKGYDVFEKMIRFYFLNNIVPDILFEKASFEEMQNEFVENLVVDQWSNVGGQLIPNADIKTLRENIQTNKLGSWSEVHAFYTEESVLYPQKKRCHAISIMQQMYPDYLNRSLDEFVRDWLVCKEWIFESIYATRLKDYTNPYRKMVYDNEDEMIEVLGGIDENQFIQEKREELEFLRGVISQKIAQ